MTFLRSTLRDLKNGLPPRKLADRLIPKGIAFIHVPKCAGTSVEQGLRAKYRLSRIMINPDPSFEAAKYMLGLEANAQNQNNILMRASELRRDILHYNIAMQYKCITGHAPISTPLLDAAARTHFFVTILRDPIERYASHLKFNQLARSKHGQIEEDIECFLEQPRAKIMGSLYGKYFSGLPMTADFTSEDAIEKSKKNLQKFSLVGFLDQLPHFESSLRELTGKNIDIGHTNKGVSTSNSQPKFNPAILEKIKSLCTADIVIYNWAKDKLQQT